MGLSQQCYKSWSSIKDIVQFACSLPNHMQISFLVVFSAISWTVWKLRNDLCFNHSNNKTFRTIILMIVALANYWSDLVKRQARDVIPAWLPTVIEEIQLRVWDPEDTQMVLYQSPTEDAAAAETSA